MSTEPHSSLTEEQLAHDVNGAAGVEYWQTVTSDVNGMLGGFPAVSRIDLQGSRTFLARFGIGSKRDRKSLGTVLDAGAGIGRITKELLLPVAEAVDVLEPVAKFTKDLQDVEGVRNIFNVGLEDWAPPADVQYDLIWTQWCLNYVNDDQLLRYLERCKAALVPETGFIVVKENLSTGASDLYDEEDSSVTRTDERFQELFEKAGLKLLRTEIQRGFPEKPRLLLPVRMYALKPQGTASS